MTNNTQKKEKTKIKFLGIELELPFKMTFKKVIITLMVLSLITSIISIKKCSVDIFNGKIEVEKQMMIKPHRDKN